ncbi:MAG: hypothetical protein ACRCTG_16720 [Aestuariivirga sp.]
MTVDPKALEEFERNMADPMWRLSNLYKILIKGDGDEDGLVIQFKPNQAQRKFIERLWHRNIILKARQLGFTTLICLVWLDHALFNSNVRCGIIAQDREAAEVIFRDKVKFAYDNLPPELKAQFPLAKDSASELLFAHNNSSIRVATSMRSGTIHRLHISEFGKICAKFPQKAAEVMTGSIPAVPKTGVIVVESTAEGQEGEFYDMTQRAMALDHLKRELTFRDYRFHFFPWWKAPEYTMDPAGVIMTRKDEDYFTRIEAEIGQEIAPEQRAWYVATREADFANSPERMWQEYPSTPEEAFQRSTEGCYYTQEMAIARKTGRITSVPWERAHPVNTFWDIGLNDEMAIWFHQRIGAQDRFIRYYENSGESFAHYVAEMHRHGYVWGRHYLPHDGDTQRLGVEKNWTPKQMLEDLGLRNIEIVPRIDRVQTGIQMTRDAFSTAWFDETGCAQGLKHLDMYRKEWDDRRGVWKDQPRHDKASNGADAFRGYGQIRGELSASASAANKRSKPRNWRIA